MILRGSTRSPLQPDLGTPERDATTNRRRRASTHQEMGSQRRGARRRTGGAQLGGASCLGAAPALTDPARIPDPPLLAAAAAQKRQQRSRGAGVTGGGRRWRRGGAVACWGQNPRHHPVHSCALQHSAALEAGPRLQRSQAGSRNAQPTLAWSCSGRLALDRPRRRHAPAPSSAGAVCAGSAEPRALATRTIPL